MQFEKANEVFWGFLYDLLDALTYSQEVRKLQDKSVEILQDYESKKKSLLSFLNDLERKYLAIEEAFNSDTVSSAIKKIMEFTKSAFEEVLKALETELNNKVDEIQERAHSERLTCLKCLESFFQTDPLPVIEKKFTMNLTNASYSLVVSYLCKDNIKYSFILSANESNLFKKQLRVSEIVKDIKIPVAFAKNWRDEISIKYENMKNYVLSRAEISSRHAYLVFNDDATSSRIIITSNVYSDNDLVAVEYSEGDNILNVTSDEKLTHYIKKDQIKKLVSTIVKEITLLEEKKSALKEIYIDETNISENLDVENLIKVILEQFRKDFENLIESSKKSKIKTSKGELDFASIKDRLQTAELSTEFLHLLSS